jgi:hypothetical protein
MSENKTSTKAAATISALPAAVRGNPSFCQSCGKVSKKRKSQLEAAVGAKATNTRNFCNCP